MYFLGTYVIEVFSESLGRTEKILLKYANDSVNRTYGCNWKKPVTLKQQSLTAENMINLSKIKSAVSLKTTLIIMLKTIMLICFKISLTICQKFSR